MDQYTIAAEILGSPGRMVSASKVDYSRENPNNTVVFNSNVCTKEGKIWYGDIDVTKDAGKLVELADALDEHIYVIREMDGRFENEAKPKLDTAVYTTEVK